MVLFYGVSAFLFLAISIWNGISFVSLFVFYFMLVCGLCEDQYVIFFFNYNS